MCNEFHDAGYEPIHYTPAVMPAGQVVRPDGQAPAVPGQLVLFRLRGGETEAAAGCCRVAA